VTTLFFLAWVAVAVLVVSKGPDLLWRRLTARQRFFSRSRGRVVLGGVFVGWAGFAFVMGWLFVRVPGRTTPDVIDSQPAPSALWQVGVTLAVIGIAAFVVAFAGAPTGKPSETSEGTDARMLVAILVATDVPLVIASVSSPDSKLRALPAGLAAIMTCVVPFVVRPYLNKD
jgi:hypothetical protein